MAQQVKIFAMQISWSKFSLLKLQKKKIDFQILFFDPYTHHNINRQNIKKEMNKQKANSKAFSFYLAVSFLR